MDVRTFSIGRVGLAAVVAVVLGTGAVAMTSAPAAGEPSSASVATVAPAAPPQLLAEGSYHTCAIVTGGKVKCWGRNDKGQLGVGDTADRGDGPGEMGVHLQAVDFGTGRTATSVAVGDLHTCALLDNGQVKCWGWNGSGGLGLGDTAARGDGPGEMGDNLPAVSLGAGRTATAVTAGYSFTCALLDNGQVKCWGYNGNGRLGLGDTSNRGDGPGEMGDSLQALAFSPSGPVSAVSAGANHACALMATGAVICWGYSAHGEVGYGGPFDQGNEPWETPNANVVALGTGRTATALSAGYGQTCVILDNGAVKCWGFNGDSRLGLGDTNNRGDSGGEMGDSLPTVNLGTGRTATSIDTGDGHICAILDNGALKCWGLNAWGQLGLGDTTTRGTTLAQMGDSLPTVNLGTGRTATAVTAGSGTCARLNDSSIKCWGLNDRGQLGQGDTTNRGDVAGEMGDALTPVRLSAAHSIEIKLDTGVDSPQDFAFTGCSGPNACGQFALDHDQDPTLPSSTSASSLSTGTYTVTMAAVPNWSLTAITCDPGETVDLAARKVTIQLGADEDVSCTFSVRTQSITIVQDTQPDLAQDFSFTGCMGQGCAPFALDDDADPTLAGSKTAVGLAAGIYTVTQTAPGANWPLQSLTCNVPQTVDLANRKVTIVLAATQSVTCTFTNKPTMVTIVLDSIPDRAQDMAFSGCNAQSQCGTYTLDDDADPTRSNVLQAPGLDPGTYTVTQAVPAGWTLNAITCSTGGTGDLANARATITVAAGQQVTCTFQGSPPPPNDAFASAITLRDPPFLFPVSVDGTNLGATKEPGEPDHAGNPGGHSVWYRVASPYTADVFLGTCSAATNFDTVLAVYHGSSVGSLTPVASNDDEGGYCTGGGSNVEFTMQAGASYLVAVDGRGGAAGAFRLTWATSTLPPCTPWPACF